MSCDIGPSEEHTVLSTDNSNMFHEIMGALAEGALIFPDPFDVVTSAALHRNFSRGVTALDVFEVERAGIHRAFRVVVTEVLPEDPETREIVNCEMSDPRTVAAMLMGLAQELMGASEFEYDEE